MQIREVLYRSAAAEITDITASAAIETREIFDIEGPSIAFIRSGLFATGRAHTAAMVDANYVVCAGEGECLRPERCGAQVCACTIIRHAAAHVAVQTGKCALNSPRAFLSCAQLLQSARRGACNIEAATLSFLCRIPADLTPPYAHAHSPLINQIRRLVNESIARRILLEDLASAFYLSPFTLSRLFHRETGVSLRSYVIRLRLRRALNMLLYGRTSLTEIALEFGFYDEPHFSKAFHLEFGISPYSVRKYSTRSEFS